MTGGATRPKDDASPDASAPPTRTLSEADSKAMLAGYGVPFAPEHVVEGVGEAVDAADALGYPVVCKLNGERIAHKTERGLVRLGLADAAAVRAAAADLLGRAVAEDGEVGILVAPMLKGSRELIAGLNRDPQFGMTVVLGVGGVLTEALADVAIRLAPIDEATAADMIDSLRTQALLGPFRGEPAVDRRDLVSVLVALSKAAEAEPTLLSADLNPLIVVDGRPVAVDALVEVEDTPAEASDRDGADTKGSGGGDPGADGGATVPAAPTRAARRIPAEAFDALFDPKGVVVAGASSHPGKFGFVALHNILACGYQGEVHATNRDGGSLLGIEMCTDIDQVPEGACDLVFLCTPAAANPDILRACAAKGITAAFCSSAGYGEAGEEGIAAQRELVALCEELGILLIGPNGQGVISTPASLCAQIVAPYPPTGRIGIASQSGNFVSSFQNFAQHYGVGVSRAVSAGNAAMVDVVDLLEYYAQDPATDVALAYVEGIPDGRAFYERVSAVAEQLPVVLVKGGASAVGARAAASHTGSLATDDRVFDGMCAQAGITRVPTIEQAYEVAATFATQPLPAGPNVCVVSTAGGWGVVTADAIAGTDLELLALPEDLREDLDTKLPPRWSRNNPIDMAGGETKDTIPDVLATAAGHPEVHSVIFLGMGIQDNQGRLEREGPFYPDWGLERIVGYHDRQDRRFTETAAALADELGKPVLTATELSVTSPDNAAVRGVRDSGKLCYASSNRAVGALAHLTRYAQWRRARAL
jgi:acyl-CoA synthetase (NDP forming)